MTGLIALHCLAPSDSRAGPAFLAALSELDAHELRWSDSQDLTVFGQSAHMRSFSTDLGLAETASLLAAHRDKFQRVLVSRNTVLISGMAGQWHWVAQLTMAVGGVNGTISTVFLDPLTAVQAANDRANHSRSWLSPSARLLHRQRMVAGSQIVIQEVHTAVMPEDELMASVARHLKARSWQVGGASGWPERTQVWRRGDERLAILATPVSIPGHTAIFLHRF